MKCDSPRRSRNRGNSPTPGTACCVLDEHDTQFLDGCRLNAPSDVTKLVPYPLRTTIDTSVEMTIAR